MKAIYLNLDPYLAAFAAWLKGGKSGPAPHFDPLPLAVTVPLGEKAAIYLPADCAALETEIEPQCFTVEGEEISILPDGYDDGLPEGTIAFNQVPALSALAPALKYAVIPVTGGSTSVGVTFFLGESGNPNITIPFTVLVRREQASGPVDLVDFTPPASAAPSAADIKSALVAAGPGALAGVSLNGTVANLSPDSDPLELSLSESNTYTFGRSSS